MECNKTDFLQVITQRYTLRTLRTFLCHIIGKHIRRALQGILLFCIAHLSFAQVTTAVASDTDAWQYIEWRQDDIANVFRYHIQIEQRSPPRGEWKQVRILYTEDNTPRVKITPQLSPGEYRYRVTAYNLLDMPSSISDWAEFVIYRAFQPEITSVTAETTGNNTMFIDQPDSGVITVKGKNLFAPKGEGASTDYTSYRLVNTRGDFIEPQEVRAHTKDNTSVELLFDTKKLKVGTYHLVAQDASGLKTKLQEQTKIRITYKKGLDTLLSWGYSPQLVLFDDTFARHFDTSFFALGLNQKLTILPIKRSWGYAGLCVHTFYTYTATHTDSYTLRGSLYNTNVSLTVQKPLLAEKLNLGAFLGAGIFSFCGYTFLFATGKTTEPLYSTTFSLCAGLTASYFFTKQFFIEAQSTFVFASIPSDIRFGAIVPTLNVGLKL